MNCKLCNHKKIVSVICTLDESKMCESCAKEHAQQTKHTEYLMKYIDWFKKQNESEARRSQAISHLKKHFSELLENLPSSHENANNLLQSRKNELKAYVAKVYEAQVKKVTENKDFAKYQLEKSFHALYSKTPSASGLAHIISSLSTEEEVNQVTFSEIVKPERCNDLMGFIDRALDIRQTVYPEGKPVCLVYLKPNTSIIYKFNTIKEKIDTFQISKKVFPMYYSWCILPDWTILYSGGCSHNEISKDVFKVNSKYKDIESYPNMILERYMHGMAYLNGYVYVFGGVSSSGNTAQCERLRLGEGSWEMFALMNKPRAKMTVCPLGGKIFIGDENDIEVLNVEDRSFKILSVFKETQYMIMVPLKTSFFILRKDNLYEVTPEPTFVTKLLTKIPLLEYYSLSQAVFVATKIYFMLDFNKSIYVFDLENNNLKLLVSLA